MTVHYLALSEPRMRAALKALALVGMLSAKYVTCEPSEPDCRHAYRDGQDGLAVIVCEREYTRTLDPATGVLLAKALRRCNKLEEASALANTLLATSARSDVLQILGKIDIQEHRLDAGRTKLENARQ